MTLYARAVAPRRNATQSIDFRGYRLGDMCTISKGAHCRQACAFTNCTRAHGLTASPAASSLSRVKARAPTPLSRSSARSKSGHATTRLQPPPHPWERAAAFWRARNSKGSMKEREGASSPELRCCCLIESHVFRRGGGHTPLVLVVLLWSSLVASWLNG
jgi:hypothetical protein